MANNAKHLYAKPPNMPNPKPNSNPELSDRLYGEHYPDSFLDMPKSIRTTSVATLGDYIQQLREVSNKSNECDKSCQSSKSHKCVSNPNTNCNCTDNNCAQQPNDNGWLTCPESGKLCSIIDCPNGCKGDSDNYIGNPYPNTQVERQDYTPCVVVGAIF
jgi:hypothetical protein